MSSIGAKAPFRESRPLTVEEIDLAAPGRIATGHCCDTQHQRPCRGSSDRAKSRRAPRHDGTSRRRARDSSGSASRGPDTNSGAARGLCDSYQPAPSSETPEARLSKGSNSNNSERRPRDRSLHIGVFGEITTWNRTRRFLRSPRRNASPGKRCWCLRPRGSTGAEKRTSSERCHRRGRSRIRARQGACGRGTNRSHDGPALGCSGHSPSG